MTRPGAQTFGDRINNWRRYCNAFGNQQEIMPWESGEYSNEDPSDGSSTFYFNHPITIAERNEACNRELKN